VEKVPRSKNKLTFHWLKVSGEIREDGKVREGGGTSLGEGGGVLVGAITKRNLCLKG